MHGSFHESLTALGLRMEESRFPLWVANMRLKFSFSRVFLALALAGLAACQSPPVRQAAPADLQLIGAEPLQLPDDCSPDRSVVIDFTVLRDGRTAGIRAGGAPACAQQALTAWVASFRYSPPRTEASTSVEWLLVEAKKGS